MNGTKKKERKENFGNFANIEIKCNVYDDV